jgi:hypothetical protein
MAFLLRTPEMAKEQKLVDIIAYEDVYHDAIKKALKWRKTKTTTKLASLTTQKMTTTGKYRFKKSNCHYLYREKFKVVKAMSTLGGRFKAKMWCFVLTVLEEAHLHQINLESGT